MATKTKRASKKAQETKAIEATSINGIMDGDSVVTTAPEIKGGLQGVLTRASKAAENRGKELHTLALGMLFGAISAPEVLALAEWPRAIKNEKTYAVKLAGYITANGTAALRDAWQGKQSKAKRASVVSLSGLASAIKPADGKAAKEGEADNTTQDVAGRAVSDAKQSPDMIATVGQIATILCDTISMEKKLAMICKLAAVKAAMDAIAATESEAKAA